MDEEEQKKALKQQHVEEQLDESLRRVLTPEAKSRLANVRLVNQELYLKAVQAIIYLFNAGQLKGKLSELQLKQLLERLAEKREIKIKRR